MYVIDVSQSVEYDHPNALEFLRKDCINVNNYFHRRHGVAVMTGKELFDFVTDLSINDDNVDDYLSAVMKTVSERSPDDINSLDAEDEVFMKYNESLQAEMQMKLHKWHKCSMLLSLIHI